MKTNRRGFFGILTGLTGGIYNAFQKDKEEIANINTSGASSEKTTKYIHIITTKSTTDSYRSGYIKDYYHSEYMIWEKDDNGKWKLLLRNVT